MIFVKGYCINDKKITLKNVASYKEASKVEFADSKKRCSFFYGLNGVGKSTLSSYLYFYRKIEEYKRHGGTPGSEIAQIATRYKDCSLEIEPNSEILVYNRDFIKKMVADEIKEKAVFAHLQDKMKSQPAKIWEELLQTSAENPTMSVEEIASRMEQLDENAEPTSPIRVIRLDFASVEQDKETIRALIEKYRGYMDMIEHAYEDVPAIVSEEKKRLLEDAVRVLRKILLANLELMKQKDLTANKIVELCNTSMLCASIETIMHYDVSDKTKKQ